MKDVRFRVLTLDEAVGEFQHFQRVLFLQELVESLGFNVRDFESPDWGAELRAWVVSQTALLRARRFIFHVQRDPGVSAMYWMHRFVRRYPANDGIDLIRGAHSSVLAAVGTSEDLLEAERLVASGWEPTPAAVS